MPGSVSRRSCYKTSVNDQRSSAGKGSPSKKLWLLPALILIGVVIGMLQPFSVEELLDFGRELGGNPLFLALVVVAMAVLFTFGLPGSLGVWLIAPFQTPVVATVLLVIGSVAGAFGAYRFSARLRGDWEPEGLDSRVVQLLSKQGGWLTQTALRTLPGFPHSVVNFAGGVLNLGLVSFLAAATVGLTFKWGVYATAIYGLVEAVESEEALDFTTVWPLLVLSVLLLLGAAAKRWVVRSTDD